MMNLGSGAGLAGLRKMECAPAGRKPLYITDSCKSRDMIIQYRMFDMAGILDSYQVKILYNTIYYILVNRWDFIAINHLLAR